jgi:CBS domain containing-hemolysin-like protein
MTDVFAWLVGAVAILSAAAVIIFDLTLRASKLGARPGPVELARETASTGTATAEFLLNEVRSQLERRTAAAQSIDTKINQFLSIVGGGAGIVAVVSFKSQGDTHKPPAALVIAAGVSLLMVLTMCAAASIPRRRAAKDLREIDAYNETYFINDGKNMAPLIHELITRYANLSEGVMISTRKKRWYYLAASSLFVLALAALLGSFL